MDDREKVDEVECPNCSAMTPPNGPCPGCGPNNSWAAFEDEPDPAGDSC